MDLSRRAMSMVEVLLAHRIDDADTWQRSKLLRDCLEAPIATRSGESERGLWGSEDSKMGQIQDGARSESETEEKG